MAGSRPPDAVAHRTVAFTGATDGHDGAHHLVPFGPLASRLLAGQICSLATTTPLAPRCPHLNPWPAPRPSHHSATCRNHASAGACGSPGPPAPPDPAPGRNHRSASARPARCGRPAWPGPAAVGNGCIGPLTSGSGCPDWFRRLSRTAESRVEFGYADSKQTANGGKWLQLFAGNGSSSMATVGRTELCRVSALVGAAAIGNDQPDAVSSTSAKWGLGPCPAREWRPMAVVCIPHWRT